MYMFVPGVCVPVKLPERSDDKYKQASLIPLLGAGFFPYMQKNTAQAAAAAQKKMQYAEHTASFYIFITSYKQLKHSSNLV